MKTFYTVNTFKKVDESIESFDKLFKNISEGIYVVKLKDLIVIKK